MSEPVAEFACRQLKTAGVAMPLAMASELASACYGYVAVDQTQLDLFAASLAAEVSAGNVPAHVLKHFVEFIGGDYTKFIG